MVTRVTTSGNYSAITANLLSAQKRQMDAGNQVATQKNGVNLKDYAKSSELLTAMRTVQTRLGSFQDQGNMIADKLATQDASLMRVADSAQAVREAMAEAIASGRVDTLVEDLQSQMNNALEGMNGRYGGKYLFAGGQVDTRPVTATTLSDLTAPPALIWSFFQNDDFEVQTQLDESTKVTTGVLASDIGTGLLTALQTFQAFNQGPNGPFTGALTDAQKTFLEGQLATWDTVRKDVTLIVAHNGTNQKRLETVTSALDARQTSLAGMLSDITDADMAKASSNLEQAQLSLQSAAYVFQALKSSSLLNYLK